MAPDYSRFILLGGLCVVLMVSVVGIVWAWIGRRVDDHPLCRGCGFDLTGKPETSTQCAECGAVLSGPRAIRVGHRRRRAGMLSLSLVMLLLSLGVSAMVVVGMVSNINWLAYEPMFLLRRQMFSTNPATSLSAVAEIDRRINSQLSKADAASLAAAILARQADMTAPWSTGWGNLMESMHRRGLLDDATRDTYIRQAISYNILVRPQINRGGRLPYRVTNTFRGADSTKLWALTQIRIEIGPKTHAFVARTFDSGSTGGGLELGGSNWGSVSLPGKEIEGFPDGPTEVRISTLTRAYLSWEDMEKRAAPPLVTVTRDYATSTDIRPASEVLVTPVSREGLAEEIKRSVRVKEPLMLRNNGISLNIDLDPAPEAYAYDIFAVFDDKTGKHVDYRIGGIAMRKNQRTGWSLGGSLEKVQWPDQVRLEFRPSPKEALETVDLTTYADAPFVLEDVEVKRVAEGK
jgi:hypothetical protein